MYEKMTLCDICHELEDGMVKGVCNVCMAKMCAIIECKTPERAEYLVRSFFKYPTSKSALLSNIKQD